MKQQHKDYLKTLLLTSVAAVGGPQSSMATTAPVVAITKEETTRDNSASEELSATLSSSVLSPGSSSSEVTGHTSHSSHSSHTSHTSSSHSSHASHYSSSGGGGGYGGSSSKNKNYREAAMYAGAAVGTAVLSYVILKIIYKHKERKARRISRRNREESAFSTYWLGSRELSSKTYGSDQNELVNLLIANGVLSRDDVQLTKSHRFYKYNSKVKKSVKKMQRRMGLQASGIATVRFQTNLKQWKDRRSKVGSIMVADTININDNRESLTAVAILLTEKGYLKGYDIDSITTNGSKEMILDAYHDFLKDQDIPVSDDISLETLTALLKLPTKR